jgi:cellulose synthase (UDP-forming)
MSRLAAWFLIPRSYARLSERYRCYRRNKASGFSAACGCFWVALAWLFLPLEMLGSGCVSSIRRSFPH